MNARVFAVGICALLVGCGPEERVCDFSEVVQVQSYDQTFRNSLGDEVDRICGNNERGIPAQYQHACKFIQDSLALRAQIAALK